MPSEFFLYIIIAVLVLGFGVLIAFLVSLKKHTSAPKDDQSFQLMMNWMKELKSEMSLDRELTQKNIHETNKQINDRLTEAARVIGGLQGKLGEMSQIGPDIRRLSEVLASPKARGNFGEEMLENMLSQVFHQSNYKSQYKFKNGEVVDMAVFVGEKILPIDSKFSMENFRLYLEAREEKAAQNLQKMFFKDIKKRVDEIHKKYILPQENTFDFALMYMPSEPVFQEALQEASIIDYSRQKKVYLVSPNTLYHHLQIILVALRGQQVNQVAEKILHMVAGIQQESAKFGKNLSVLSGHIKNAGNSMASVSQDYEKLSASITNAANLQLEASEDTDSVSTKQLN